MPDTFQPRIYGPDEKWDQTWVMEGADLCGYDDAIGFIRGYAALVAQYGCIVSGCSCCDNPTLEQTDSPAKMQDNIDQLFRWVKHKESA